MSDQAMKDIKKDIYIMMHKAEEMLELTEDAFMKNKLSALDEAAEISREIKGKEDILTEKLAKTAASSGEARNILSIPVHIEKIAVRIERIMENIRLKIQDGILFSDKAIQESARMMTKGKDLLRKAGEAMVTGSASATDAVQKDSESLIGMSSNYATAHEERLVTGECSPKSSSTYLCMLYAFEDLASYTRDIVRKMSGK
jgi:Na+/phosphate symporter